MTVVIRVSILGAMPGGEVWSINPVWVSSPSVTTIPYSNLLGIATDVDSVFPTPGFLDVMDNETTITGSRVECRELSGELINLAEHTRSSPVPGSGVQPHPYQTALVVSLRTAVAGPRGRGRLYVPATGAAISGSTLRLTSSVQTAFLTAAETYLGALNVSVNTHAALSELCVWSRTGESAAPVTKISVGDVLDTQRRRRDTLVENVMQADYVP